MLFWFGSSLVSPVFFKHCRIPFSCSLFFFFPKGNTSIAFIDEERKKSKQQATKLMRGRLMWQPAQSKTNYASSCRCTRFRRRQWRRVAGAVSALPPPQAHQEVCSPLAQQTACCPPPASDCSAPTATFLSKAFSGPCSTPLHTHSNLHPKGRGGFARGILKIPSPPSVGQSWEALHTLSAGPLQNQAPITHSDLHRLPSFPCLTQPPPSLAGLSRITSCSGTAFSGNPK